MLQDPEGRRLIRQRVEELMNTIEKEGSDTLVFLDRSARPISWLLKDLWEQRTPQRPCPKIRFVAIGRTLPPAHPQTEEAFWAIQKMLRQGPAELRDRLKKHGEITDNNDLASINVPVDPGAQHAVKQLQEIYGHQFDERSVLIVDDLAESGVTKVLAALLFQSAFPAIKRLQTVHLFDLGEDRVVRWLQRPGFSGVMESYDDRIVAQPLTQAGVEEEMRKLTQKTKIEAWNLQNAAIRLRTEMTHQLVAIRSLIDGGQFRGPLLDGLQEMESQESAILEAMPDNDRLSIPVDSLAGCKELVAELLDTEDRLCELRLVFYKLFDTRQKWSLPRFLNPANPPSHEMIAAYERQFGGKVGEVPSISIVPNSLPLSDLREWIDTVQLEPTLSEMQTRQRNLRADMQALASKED